MIDTHIPGSNAMELENSDSTTPRQPSISMVERNADASVSSVEKGSMSRILRNSTVQLMAVFLLVYVGVEVTIGGSCYLIHGVRLYLHHEIGWIVTFIINVRGGGPSSGYISSGFFGGLTFGRVALLWINKTVGERRVIFIYAILAIA
jgi:fucose permease